ncbi:hypothetical protein [Pseudomonas aeruginosa]|uniref:hypothetical protein n=1 Tax=Pseudomonas aeruginosa TaxID=287 RepID=UPI00366D7A6D
MSKQSYTPGPWDYWSGYNPVDELEAQITTEDGDIVIASYNRQIPEGEANAKLLAAAPEPHEALVALVECEQTTPELWEAARAAIAKATA